MARGRETGQNEHMSPKEIYNSGSCELRSLKKLLGRLLRMLFTVI